MPKPPIIAPPLPATPPGVWWAVLMLKHGPTPAAKFASYFCLEADLSQPFTTPQAVLIAQGFWQNFGFALSTISPSSWYIGPTSCWAWDGVTLHTGSSPLQLAGALPFTKRMAERPALVIRRGAEAGQVVFSRWYGPPLSSAYSTASYDFTPLGVTTWRGFAGNLSRRYFINGTQYLPRIHRSQTTGSLLAIQSVELYHKPAFLRKRNREQPYVRDSLPPPNFPTALG